jgi:hypothetical protein
VGRGKKARRKIKREVRKRKKTLKVSDVNY